MSDAEHPVPPAGEDIHLPAGSMKPFMCGLGITLTVIGTTIFTPYVLILGLIIFLTTTYKWIQDVRSDVAALPEDHAEQH